MLVVDPLQHDPLAGLAQGQHQLGRHALGKVERPRQAGAEALDHAAAVARPGRGQKHRLRGDARVQRADGRHGLGRADHDVAGRTLAGLGAGPIPQAGRPRQAREGGLALLGRADHAEAQLLHVVAVGGQAREVDQLQQKLATDRVGLVVAADAARAAHQRGKVREVTFQLDALLEVLLGSGRFGIGHGSPLGLVSRGGMPRRDCHP